MKRYRLSRYLLGKYQSFPQICGFIFSPPYLYLGTDDMAPPEYKIYLRDVNL